MCGIWSNAQEQVNVWLFIVNYRHHCVTQETFRTWECMIKRINILEPANLGRYLVNVSQEHLLSHREKALKLSKVPGFSRNKACLMQSKQPSPTTFQMMVEISPLVGSGTSYYWHAIVFHSLGQLFKRNSFMLFPDLSWVFCWYLHVLSPRRGNAFYSA